MNQPLLLQPPVHIAPTPAARAEANELRNRITNAWLILGSMPCQDAAEKIGCREELAEAVAALERLDRRIFEGILRSRKEEAQCPATVTA